MPPLLADILFADFHSGLSTVVALALIAALAWWFVELFALGTALALVFLCGLGALYYAPDLLQRLPLLQGNALVAKIEEGGGGSLLSPSYLRSLLGLGKEEAAPEEGGDRTALEQSVLALAHQSPVLLSSDSLGRMGRPDLEALARLLEEFQADGEQWAQGADAPAYRDWKQRVLALKIPNWRDWQLDAAAEGPQTPN